MRLGILSRNPALYSTRRLKETAFARGHDVRVVDYSRCSLRVTHDGPSVDLDGEALFFDAIIPRIGASMTYFGTAVVRQFESMGVFVTNDARSIAESRDKLVALQRLAGAGIDLPITGFARPQAEVTSLVETVGTAPVVVKLCEGSHGTGVVLAETVVAAEAVVSAFRQLGANFLVQEYISEAAGSDIRAFVVGGAVVAAMKRTAPAGDFRSNIHRGGSAEGAQLSRKEREAAVRAATTLGLGVAGVDILRSARGPVVMEVNSSPGLEGIEGASGVDVADEVIAFIESSRRSKGASRRWGLR